jgi:DNA-binding PadR family transcriptional regulator
MDEQIPIRTVLLVLAGRGPASLESLIRELEKHSTASNVARGFQAARAQGLIEAEPGYAGGGDPLYRLTPRGLNALGRRAVRRVPDRRSRAHRQSRRTEAVSLQSVLDVLADFDQFGGASLELVAWELDVDESAVSAAWSQAIDDGLLEQSGTDHVLGEKMWRLSDKGRHAREDSVSG